jgi:hypothetical protein
VMVHPRRESRITAPDAPQHNSPDSRAFQKKGGWVLAFPYDDFSLYPYRFPVHTL